MQGFLRKFSGGEKGSSNATPNLPPTVRFGEGENGDNGMGMMNEKITPEITPSDDSQSQTRPYPQPQAALPSAAQLRGGPEHPYARGNLPRMPSDDPIFSSTTFRPSSAPVSPATEIPPWERLELPVFQIDGQRYGGPSGFGSTPPTSAGFGSTQQGIFGGWKGLNTKKRPSTANSSGSATPGGAAPNGSVPAFGSGSPAQHYGQRMGSISAGGGGVAFDASSSRSRQQSGETTGTSYTGNGGGGGGGGDPRRKLSSNATGTTANTTTNLLPAVQRRPSAILRPETSPVMEQGEMDFLGGGGGGGASSYPSTIHAHVPAIRNARQRGGSDFDSDLQGSRRPSQRDEEDQRNEGDRDGQDEDEDEGSSDGENEMDLLRMLRQDPEPQGGVQDEIELVPESMASYLNRKTALLMLWFPLGVGLEFLFLFPPFPVPIFLILPRVHLILRRSYARAVEGEANPLVCLALLNLAYSGHLRLRGCPTDCTEGNVEMVRVRSRCT